MRLRAPSGSFDYGSQRARAFAQDDRLVGRLPILAFALVLVDGLFGPRLFLGAGFFGLGFAAAAEARSWRAGVGYRFGAREEGELEAALLAVDAVQDYVDFLA
jgi:hypothetical protein